MPFQILSLASVVYVACLLIWIPALNDAVSAGKWRVCIDTSNLLGGPFQMVFTTNGVKQILDNVYAPTFDRTFLCV